MHKSKQKSKNNNNQQANIETDPQKLVALDTQQKTSSSKARRLRKLKLKTVKRAEEVAKTNEETQEEDKCNEEPNSPDSGDKIDLVIVMDEEEVRRAGGVVLNEEMYYSENSFNGETVPKNAVELKENNSSKSKTKKNNKSKGFSLSNIFKTDKNHNRTENLKPTTETIVSETNNENSTYQEKPLAETPNIISTDVNEISTNFIEEFKISNKPDESTNIPNNTKDSEIVDNIFSEEHIEVSSPNTKTTTFTIIEIETCPKSKIEEIPNKSSSPVLDVNKSEAMDLTEVKQNPPLQKLPRKMYETKDTHDKEIRKSVVRRREKERSPTLSKSSSGSNSRPISIFVVPPDNVAEETEAPEVDWESVSDLETRSTDLTDDDDVRPETLVHLPSNDLHTSAAVKDGRNGIVQVDDYELSVRDLYTPFIDPEEEAKLRQFLETLNLTKSEEYDDTSSTKSYGDSSSTTMSTSSPIPPTVAPSDEIVIYRHMKSHCVAEPCFIPSRNQRYLDVITEESSDPSDSERRHSRQPWEDPDQIRKNNEIPEIPNDWYGSDEEPETTSDEGGIVSWRNGKKLEDVDGVEVVYLSDSEDGDDEQSINTLVDEKDMALQNKENIPELVVVHAVDNKDIKRKVNLKPLLEQQRPGKISVDNLQNEKHAMDEIISILDSTYEINKDLFIVQSHANNHNTDKVSTNLKDVPKKKKVDTQSSDISGFQNTFSGKVCTYIINPEISTPQIVNYYTEQLDRNTTKTNSDEEIPVPEVRSVTAASPALSRQGSSSSATSQSTAKYNPAQSPMSSEAEDKSDIKIVAKKKQTKKVYNPKTLTSLSIDVIANLAHGEFYLNKICGNDTSIFGCREGNAGSPNGKLTSLPPSGLSTRRSSYFELEGIHPSSSRDMSPSRPMLIQSPPPSALTSPPVNDDPWVGLPTSTDPKLLVCLSPSQSKDTLMTTPKEASELLELHRKFVERRGYHETNTSKRNSICSPRSCNSPDLIRLDPYESNKSQIYTPELLIEAANLLALKEYRQSRFKSGVKSEPATSGEISGRVLKKSGLSEVTSQRTKIAADSEDPDLNRSAGTSRLLALIQEHPAPHSDNTACPVKQRDNMSDNRVQLHRYSGSYISEWLTISENVLTNGDVTNTNGVNGVHEQRQFEADKYKISKQGDIAIIQTRDDRAKLPPRPRSERPKSLPPAGLPTSSPSGGELFREQMYNEYMNKVAERSERRQQKVIKISSLPSSTPKSEPETDKNPQTANQLESEFMTKARERMSKLGIDLDGEEQPQENGEEKSPEELPKHLQEFMELAATAPLAEEPSGELMCVIT